MSKVLTRPLRVLIQGKDPLGKAKYANVTESGDLRVQLSGNIMEIYGATVDQRPDPTTVPVGAAYMAVNTGEVWQSNGFEWVKLT